MTNEETIAIFKEALKEKGTPGNYDTRNIIEVIFKIVVALAIMAIGWIFNTTNQLKQDVSNMHVENQYTKKTFEKLDEFMGEPRFTKEDFESSIAPLIKQVQENSLELSKRTLFIENTNEKLIRMEIRLQDLEKTKKQP